MEIVATGVEVILNGNTLENSNDQYISMVLEKTVAGPAADADFFNCATSSECTPGWVTPGHAVSFLMGEAEFGRLEFQALLSGPLDPEGAFLSVQAGAGGTESCDWAQMLLRMYMRWAEMHGYSVEIVDELKNEEAGIQSAQIRVIGDYAYGYLQGESGVHRLVRISPFGKGDTRQTSFAAVDVLPELPDDIEIVIKDGDIEWKHFSTGGPGGTSATFTRAPNLIELPLSLEMSMISAHHMVNPRKYGPNRPQRRRLYRAGMRHLQQLVHRLSARGPVFLAGDMNSQFKQNDPWGPRAA